jgi:hypothetical protein
MPHRPAPADIPDQKGRRIQNADCAPLPRFARGKIGLAGCNAPTLLREAHADELDEEPIDLLLQGGHVRPGSLTPIDTAPCTAARRPNARVAASPRVQIGASLGTAPLSTIAGSAAGGPLDVPDPRPCPGRRLALLPWSPAFGKPLVRMVIPQENCRRGRTGDRAGAGPGLGERA